MSGRVILSRFHFSQLLPNHNFNLLSTVQANKEYYSESEIQGANNARLLQEQLAWPGTQTLKTYIKHSLINNNSVTIEDIDRANDIYGPAEHLLSGKMKRCIQQVTKYNTFHYTH